MATHPQQPSNEPWCDADGTHAPVQCRVEQIAVDQKHGALLCRLHQQGRVIGRGGGNLLYVIFDHGQQLRPDPGRPAGSPPPLGRQEGPRREEITTKLARKDPDTWHAMGGITCNYGIYENTSPTIP